MFAKFSDGLLRVSRTPAEGYKPMVNTDQAEAPKGFHPAFFWRETETNFEQLWEIVPDYYETTAEDKAEAYDILMGG